MMVFLLPRAADYKITVLLLSLYYILMASVKTENSGLRVNCSAQNMHSVGLNRSYSSVTLFLCDFEIHMKILS